MKMTWNFGWAASIAVMIANASTQSSDLAQITSSVFASGGGTSSAGGYTFAHTLGQSIAGTASGGDYTLSAGFWNAVEEEFTPCENSIDFAQGLPAGTAATGTTPPSVADGVLHLTDAINGQGNYWITPLPPRTVQAVNARWKTLIGGGGSLGADGLSFNLGMDLGTSFTAEEGAASGLALTIDTWDNGEADAVGIDIKWNGQQIAFTQVGDGTTEAQGPLRPNQFVDTTLEVSPSGLVTFTYAGLSVSGPLPNYTGIEANQYVFAARTGGASDNHWIDDLCISFADRPSVDLAIDVSPANLTLTEGDSFAVTVTVSNAGPSIATTVQLTSSLPPGVTVASLTSSVGGCQVEGSNIVCTVSTLAPQQSFALALTANTEALPDNLTTELTDGVIWQFLTSSVELERNPADNRAQVPLVIFVKRDFGDAPDTTIAAAFQYPTLRVDNGARHRLAGPYFGGSAPAIERDRDPNGMPTINADGDDVSDGNDDEAGVRFLDPLVAGAAMVRVEVNAPAGGTVDAWIDFNRDGHWVMSPSVEQIFTGRLVPAGVSVHTITVPPGAVVGTTYARFRISDAGGLGFSGYANNGEVEDYVVSIDPSGGNENPDLAVNPSVSPLVVTENIAQGLTLTVSNRGVATATAVQLTVDAPVGLRILSATNSGGSCHLQGNSNVVCSVPSLASNAAFTVMLNMRANFLPEEAEEFENLGDLTAVLGSTEPDLNLADNSLTVPVTIHAQTDWGDARGGFPVTVAENGPHHRYSPAAPWLGTRWDNDEIGNHSPAANFDDTHGASDDEDGIEFSSPLVSGANATVIVICRNAPGFLDAWADFYGNTNWSDASEQIFASLPLPVGSNTLTFAVPSDAVPGMTTTRWRVSTTGGLTYTGYAGFGEVEDHLAEIQSVPGVDLQLTVMPERVEVTEGDSFSVNVLVSNRGTAPASGIEITSALPPGVTVASITSIAGACQVQGSNIICAVSNLDPQQSISVALVATAASLPADLANEFWWWDDWFFSANSAEADSNMDNNRALLPLLIYAHSDFGDAPDTAISASFLYPTRRVDNGARHRLTGPYFGGSIGPMNDRDSDADGMPSLNADGDDVGDGNNDERGIQFLNPLYAGLTVNVQINASAAAKVDAWWDFNADYDWGDAGEQVFASLDVPAGISVHPVTIPAAAKVGITYARFRISTAGGLAFTGFASNGEVEDHQTELLCPCSCSTNGPRPNPDPLLTSWFTDNSGQYAQVRLHDADTPTTEWISGMAPEYADIQKIQESLGFVYVSAPGLASYVMGAWYLNEDRTMASADRVPVPLVPRNQNLVVRFSKHPHPASTASNTPLGMVGLWANGTAVYDTRDGHSWNKNSLDDFVGPQGSNIWHRNAFFAERITWDYANQHQPENGQVHAHVHPSALRQQLGEDLRPLVTLTPPARIVGFLEPDTPTHSPIIGWAFDGNPIYGPYGYSDPQDATSPIRRMVSGYILRDGSYGTANLNGAGRTSLPLWAQRVQGRTTLMTDEFGPHPNHLPVGTYALGRYAEDYEYLGDLPRTASMPAWDLDQFNGRCCKTPEFPNGTYAYFVTIESNGVPAFPYTIGLQYCGVVSGGVVENINEQVETYFEAKRPRFTQLQPNSGTITLEWSSREGGTYRVLASDDLQTWTQLAPSVPSGGKTTTYTHDPGPAPPPKQFYRVDLERDGSPSTKP